MKPRTQPASDNVESKCISTVNSTKYYSKMVCHTNIHTNSTHCLFVYQQCPTNLTVHPDIDHQARKFTRKM